MPGGRPPKYDPAYHPVHAYKLALLSHTDEEMAGFFEIPVETFYRWQREHEEFRQAVSAGKVPADADVAVSFHRRATGYDIKTEKIFCFQGEVIRAETTTHVPPDPGAALNWLKNRQPGKWRDRKSLDLEDDDGQALAFPVVRVFVEKPEEPKE
ncbi:helix-turn-helix domain-containing protein [Microvirga sp. HBU67558]|uniref:helix-turn-helix domain-containing protein n=1 Tax=Microvirga TaxID=186650 RepID=UPI001B378F5B|nr:MULTISPECIES: helix-turn-helix domain-containing protein [unclassified Microvirga]MBQ0819269.1 helix-turn-helix domain-containing protein [Microvirga sp. HBU67558]